MTQARTRYMQLIVHWGIRFSDSFNAKQLNLWGFIFPGHLISNPATNMELGP